DALVQRVADLDDPGAVEIVERPRRHAGPVVDGHGSSSSTGNRDRRTRGQYNESGEREGGAGGRQGRRGRFEGPGEGRPRAGISRRWADPSGRRTGAAGAAQLTSTRPGPGAVGSVRPTAECAVSSTLCLVTPNRSVLTAGPPSARTPVSRSTPSARSTGSPNDRPAG